MANQVPGNIERRHESGPDKGGVEQRKGHEAHSKEIKETSKGFMEGVSEVVEGVEAAEAAEGNVAESAGEGKKRAPVVGIKTGGKQDGSVATAEKDAPSIEIMQIQVAIQIKNEIRVLEKEVVKLLKDPSGLSAFKLNVVVSKIRNLKDILANLAYATAETIKELWGKFIKGIKA
jgi:hypothetical protein